MYTVKKTLLENIRSIYGSNSINVARYTIVKNRLNGLRSDFEFAKPILQEGEGYILWKSNENRSYKPFTEVNSNELKGKIKKVLSDAVKSFQEALPEEIKNENSFLENLIEIPSEDSVYFTTNGELKVLLINWGFVIDEINFKQGVLRKMLPDELSSTIIQVVNKLGTPLKNYSFQFVGDNLNQEMISNDDGKLFLNGFEKYTEYKLVSLNSGKEKTLTINNEEFVRMVFPDFVELNFIFSNIDFTNINAEVNYVSYNENKSLEISNNGKALMSQLVDVGQFQLYYNGEQIFQSEIPEKDTTYEIGLKKTFNPIHEPLEKEVGLEEHEEIEPVRLIFKRRNKKPIKSQVIEFYGRGPKDSFTTDETGTIRISKDSFSHENTVFSSFKKAQWKKDFNYNGEAELIFTIKNRRFLWLWLPLSLLLFFLLTLIPLPISHQFTVFDAYSHKPLSEANISSTFPFETENEYNIFETDTTGKVTLDYGKQSLWGQIFSPEISNFVVRRSDYLTENGLLELGKFSNNKSEVYLEKPIYEKIENVQPCGGGENQDETGVQEKTFDLGKANSHFLFEYYNDSQIDTIRVITEFGQEIFKCNTATNTIDFQDYVNLTSPTRYVTVSVEGQSNWGIRVNCPE